MRTVFQFEMVFTEEVGFSGNARKLYYGIAQFESRPAYGLSRSFCGFP
jgi:hypothetical protein